MHSPQHNLRLALHRLIAAFVVIYALCVYGATDAHAAATTGPEIYADQCARCHGKSGEGTADNYPDPLAGDKSVPQLAKLIHETMPDDADTKCSAEDAEKVAAYIYDAFYSVDARVRNKPARVELSRLTVRQHQNALADLIGSFRRPLEWKPDHGLHAAYYGARAFKSEKLKLERTDPEVRFDWETSSPDPEKLEPQEFSIQ
jgi:cytochrome c553